MTNKGFGKQPKKKEIATKEELQHICDLMNAGNPEGFSRYAQMMNDMCNKCSEQEGSTMIHEKDYVPMNCCLCGKHMSSIHDTHNPFPLTPRCYAKKRRNKTCLIAAVANVMLRVYSLPVLLLW